jgi:hypothetical protein
MSIGKNSFVPEGFTRNIEGEVVKGTNERRKTVAGVLYHETKNIKRPKKNANVRQHKKEVAEGKNKYDSVITERMGLNKPYEDYCNKNGHVSFRKFEKLGNRATQRRK